jgi:hybrid cluster-associated redox disulfide protein
MKRTGMELNMTVDEIMRRWPATIRVFIRYRMLCIGCPIGIFHTVKDACEAHDLDRVIFSRELLAAVRDDEEIEPPAASEVNTTGNSRERARRRGPLPAPRPSRRSTRH